MEVRFMDVPGACPAGRKHAELAQIHRTRRTYRVNGEWFYPKHRVEGTARPARGFHVAP